MASSGVSQESIEEKKQALLRRIEEKRKAALQGTNSGLSPSTVQTSSNPMQSGAMFANDGNFFERFQAMQQQQQQKSQNRPLVSMKLTTVKKAAPTKPAATRLDVFEKPELDETSYGNFPFEFSDPCNLPVIKHSMCLRFTLLNGCLEILRYVSDGRCN